MSVHGALSIGDLAKAAGVHTASWGLLATQNTLVGSATVVSLNVSAATITVTSPSAGWGNVIRGLVAVVTRSGALVAVLRVRLEGSATTLYIMQSSAGDPGLTTISLRTAGITAGDLVSVYDRKDVFSVIPRIIASTNTIYEDFDQSVSSENFEPGPIVNIFINGESGDYWTYLDPGLYSYATITLTTTTALWPTSLSVVSYQWTVPVSWGAPVAGSPTSASVTYAVPAGGLTNYVISLLLYDDNGTPRTGWRDVWVLDRASTTPIVLSRLDSLTSDRSGTRATITLDGTRYTSIPGKGDKVMLVGEVKFGGQTIASAWTKVTGWIMNVIEGTDSGGRTFVTLDIEGPTGMLTKLGAFSQYVKAVGTSIPGNWQEYVSALCTMDFLIFWLAAVRAKSMVAILNWTTSNVVNTSQDLPLWVIAGASNIYQQMVALGARRRANVGANPDGEMMVRLHPSLIAYASRSAYTITRMTVTTAMLTAPLRFNKTPYPATRRTRGEAFMWDGNATQPTPFLGDAPGASAGQGSSDDTMQSQIVDSQTELNQATGDQYAMQNNPYASIELHMRGLYGLLIYCAEMTYLRLQIAAAYRPDGVAVDMNVIPLRVTIQETSPHVFASSIEVEGETAGSNAITVPVPVQVTVPSTFTSPPAVPEAPALGTPTHDGRTVFAFANNKLGVTFNWPTSDPWTDITGNLPADALWDLFFEPFCSFLLNIGTTVGNYALLTSGLYYCANALTASPVWSLKAAIDASYWGVLRPSHAVAGRVYVAANASAGDNYTVRRLDNYGASTTWSQPIGVGAYGGMDIDPFGDEALVGSDTGQVYRILNGAAPVGLLSSPPAGAITWLQRPLTTLSGAPNVAGASELYYILCQGENKLYRCVGNAKTDITPPGAGTLLSTHTSSIAFVSDANRLVIQDYNNDSVWTSTDGGDSWTGPISAGSDGFLTSGYFPRTLNGNYALYAGQVSRLSSSSDFGATWSAATGSFATDVGAIGSGFLAVIPGY